jgi:hypothetical protein
MRWRRLCVDVDNDGTVIGGSVEFYDDAQAGRITKLVVPSRDWERAEPHELLDVLLASTWHQPTLPFVVKGRPDY